MLEKRKLLMLLNCFLLVFFLLFPVEAASPTPPSTRLGGMDRYETAVKVSQDGWTQSDYVILVSGENFPDAISAAPLAKKYNGPILITEGNKLNSLVYQEVQRLKTKNVIIVGGTGVITSTVEQELKDINVQVTRISGQDRYETSAKVAKIIGTNNGVVLASGGNFPDALSIASIAAVKQMPILLTTDKVLPDSVKDFIDNNNINSYYVVGGTAVVSDSIVNSLPNAKRLSGADRYETNVNIINEFLGDLNFSTVYLTYGQNFPDALCGSAAAAKDSAPIILTNSSDFKSRSLIQSKIDSISLFKILGGTGVISDSLVKSIISSSKTVLGYTTYYYPGDNSSYNSLSNYSNYIDEIATDTYSTDSLGNITGYIPSKQLNYANSNNIISYAMVANYFDGKITKSLLESSENRQRLINNLLQAVKQNNYKGVNIDLEGIYSYNRSQFTTFMSELYNTFHSQGFLVTVAIPAKTWDNPVDGWSGAYDYEKIGEYSDKVIIMAYDYHWSGGTPGSIAPIDWVQKVVDYTVKVIPKEKIVLGLAAYAYDWPANGAKAESYSLSETYSVASKYGAVIKWDSVSKSSYYNYTDSSGIYHTVWFEDSTSIGYKLDIVNNFDLSGISIWRLGLEDSDYWKIIGTKFNR
jgi:Predicted glycosyl hydrolase